MAPQGSACDRACELYAQIAGTRTDYGAAHCREYRHPRFGRDFSGQTLVPSWDESTRLVLIGHSFGGSTIRLLAELLANGSEEERAATPADSLSPLFAGSMGERVRVIVTLAAPSNGTTAYEMAQDKSFDMNSVKVSRRHRLLDRLMRSRTKIKTDGRDPRDRANFDMMLDNAQALDAKLPTMPHVYYLSVACDATVPGDPQGGASSAGKHLSAAQKENRVGVGYGRQAMGDHHHRVLARHPLHGLDNFSLRRVVQRRCRLIHHIHAVQQDDCLRVRENGSPGPLSRWPG